MKKTLILLLATATLQATAQNTFDPGDGCLNTVSLSSGPGIGEYGDRCLSAHYMHEKFISEQFTVGAGLGYSYHDRYRLSAIPVYLSARYFFMDRSFSPFVHLRAGGFGIIRRKNIDNQEPFSVSHHHSNFNLFVSPSIGVKLHLASRFGVMASVSNDFYLLNAYDTKKGDYRHKLVGNWGINIGAFFQIPGW